jgi:glycosyltransferase involved in cell wall biosynthesis
MVSVITVVYNGEATIEATIRSVVEQEYKGLEYIVIDGGSTDGTVAIIRKYESRISWWKSESDKGIYDAMNKGIELAKGDWINFMNAGDIFASNEVLNLFEGRVTDADVIYGDAIIQYPGFTTLWKKTALAEMWKRSPFCHQASFVKSSVMRKYKFDLAYRIGSDFDLFYRIYLDGGKFSCIEKVICVYDLIDGISEKNRSLSLQEQKRSVLEKNFSAGKWIYFTARMTRQMITAGIKKVIGKKTTAWIVRYLKA